MTCDLLSWWSVSCERVLYLLLRVIGVCVVDSTVETGQHVRVRHGADSFVRPGLPPVLRRVAELSGLLVALLSAKRCTARDIHLFPNNFGQSARNSVKVQPISTLRLPNHARPAAELPNRRNCLHYFRNACTVALIGRKKV